VGTSHPAVFAFMHKCSIYHDMHAAGIVSAESLRRLIDTSKATLADALGSLPAWASDY
jgi:hypothetical protein